MIEQIVKLIVEFWKFFQFWAVLDAEHLGFIRRLGVPHRDMSPGLNWHWPLRFETPETVDARGSACMCDPQTLTTVDGAQVLLQLKISYCVVDAQRYFLKVFEPGNNLQDVAAGELGALVRDLPAKAVFDGTLVKFVTTKIKRKGTSWGLEVSDVELTTYCKTRTYRLVNSNYASAGQE